MIETLLKLITLLACLIILWQVEPALNRMSPCTHWSIRYAMLILGAGAMYILLTLSATTAPSIGMVLLMVGIAALLLAERRFRHIHRRGGKHHA